MSFEGTVQMCICEKYFELKMYDVFHHQIFFSVINRLIILLLIVQRSTFL